MEDSTEISVLLRKASEVFTLCAELSVLLQRELKYQSDNPPAIQPDRDQRRAWFIETTNTLNHIVTSLTEMQQAIQQPPTGFSNVADGLRGVARLAHHCLEQGRVGIVQNVGKWFLFNLVGELGCQAVSEARSQLRMGSLQAILAAPEAPPPANGGEDTGDGDKANGTDNDPAVTSLLGIYTNGVADERIRQAEAARSNKDLKANEKLKAIHKALPIPDTATAEQLGKALGVTASAIKKTQWWKDNRTGKRAEAVNERKERLLERGRLRKVNIAADD